MIASLLWGCLIDNSPDPAALDQLVSRTGKPPSVIVFGRSAMRNGTYLNPADLAWPFKTARARGAYAMLDLFTVDGADYSDPNWTLASVTSGIHDDWFRKVARFLAAFGYPIFVRLDGEMNLTGEFHRAYCEWSDLNSAGGPGQFAAMWRHVVDVFRAEGTSNLTWVWCPNIVAPNAPPLAQLYPGDDYVDWLGIDGYNPVAWSDGMPWQTFDQVFSGYEGMCRDSWDELCALGAGTKPIMIGETGCHEDARKAAWIVDALSKARRAPYSDRLRALLYFDAAGAPAEWRLSGDSAKAFARGIADEAYQASGNLQIGMQSIQPLTPVVVPRRTLEGQLSESEQLRDLQADAIVELQRLLALAREDAADARDEAGADRAQLASAQEAARTFVRLAGVAEQAGDVPTG